MTPRPTADLARNLLRTVHLIREFETAAGRAFAAGEIPGFIHLSIGQEAVAAGVCAALDDRDKLTSTHRGHGHCIAKGVPIGPMMAELFGKVTGTSKGKGYAGTIKRHHFKRGPASHGSHNIRQPGSIGAAAYPARVFKGLRMSGRMGGKRATQLGLEVFDADADRNLLYVRGAVPGGVNGIVIVRPG